jgi:predicted PurR-regulated permease PerM
MPHLQKMLRKRLAQNKKIGPIIGTLTVIIILIAVAVYIFASQINKQVIVNQKTSVSTTSATSTKNIADDIQTLKNDLNNAIK